MTKIISTVGPILSNKNIGFIVKNSGIVVTEYSYDAVIWGIIAVGLFIVSLTMIM